MSTKPCSRPGCDGMLKRRAREDNWSWGRRKYCCRQCAIIYTRLVRKTGVDDRQVSPVSAEHVEPPYTGLLGYHSSPPPHLAAGVMMRMMRGAL